MNFYLHITENTSWDAIDQLTKATYALGVFQVTLIILFATVGGERIRMIELDITILISYVFL
jgi:hypothetical protein